MGDEVGGSLHRNFVDSLVLGVLERKLRRNRELDGEQVEGNVEDGRWSYRQAEQEVVWLPTAN